MDKRNSLFLVKISFSWLMALGLIWIFVRTTSASSPEIIVHSNFSSNSTVPFKSEAPGQSLQILDEDSSGITLEFNLSDWHFEQAVSQDGPCQLIHAAEFLNRSLPGSPSLPVGGGMVGVPPSVDLNLQIAENEWVVVNGIYDICPTATPVIETTPAGETRITGQQVKRDPVAYNQTGFYPETSIEIASQGYIRSQRVAVVKVQPFQYNPISGELRYASRIRFRISFLPQENFAGPALQTGSVDEGYFEPAIQRALLNYASARDSRVLQSVRDRIQPTLPGLNETAYKLLVSRDGIFTVTYSDLQAADVSVDNIDPRTFHLHNFGQEVALYLSGGTDGVFRPGDFLVFFGQKANTKWTDTNTYWLTWNGSFGLNMGVSDGSPNGAFASPRSFSVTQKIEKNLTYFSATTSGSEKDHWYWAYMSAATKPVKQGFTFSLPQVATEPISATLSGLFASYFANPQHHTRVYINQHLVDNAFWPHPGEYDFKTNFSQSFLISGTNVITVELPRESGVITTDVTLINRFAIDYARWYTAAQNELLFTGQPGEWEFQVGGFTTNTVQVFDVTTPTLPVHITGVVLDGSNENYRLRFEQSLDSEHRYLAMPPARWLKPQGILEDSPSDLHNPENAADYIIISHGDFITDVQPLADWRISQGLRVKVVDVQDVYDEFSYGLLDPQAVHDFLAYAYENWQKPAPAYVLLVGDGNHDFLNYSGYNDKIFIPPYLADVDHWIGETAANNRYVTVSGDDPLPDMFLGILPVRTRSNAAEVVNKIISYEQNPPQNDWNKTTMFVADKFDPDAGDFPYYSDQIINNHLPAPYSAEKIYYKITHQTAASVQSAIIGGINQGRLLVSYTGHGALQQWGADKLFSVDLVPQLNNAGKLPFVASLTCMDGYYFYPKIGTTEYMAVAESLVRTAGKGAIASFSPTGWGLATGHDALERGLFDALFQDYDTDLGSATTLAKLFMYSSTGGGYEDLVETYLLFGDPATELQVLRPDLKISKFGEPSGLIYPGYQITYRIGFTNTGEGLATHVILSDTLPADLEDALVTSSGVAITARPGSRYIWEVADMVHGQSGQITITARLPVDYHGWLNNAVTIASPGDVTAPEDRRATWLMEVFYRLLMPVIGKG
jgi:uncharacterized repeat protein (TIGR01451 family)